MSTLASSNQSSTRFFSALRHLARDVDDGMRKLQQRFEPGGQSTTDGQGQHVTGMKLTLEWKKEIEALMKSGHEVLRDMKDKSKQFETSLQIIQELIDIQQTQTVQIQSYLQQYGYLLPTEETSSCTEGSETNAEKTELNQNNPIEKAPQQSNEMSPRLEDFGISSYTLSMLSHPKVAELQQDFKVSTGFSQRSQNQGANVKHDFIPTPFQNKGLMVTPSLFPDCNNSIYGRSEDLTCSPTCSIFTKIGQTPLCHQVQELKHSPDKKIWQRHWSFQTVQFLLFYTPLE
ncbi:uncharacterized protein LOC112566652 isoform X2 [Pomacea canaliculata]|uniref:uncharacterized protein LOC112566652 isoform X2 n=1 Tax=Pomacea canaliculata TaxID=400727 RepID=UPI000D72F39F|nr:uncharacterized protein LOC112566652 isoform X2 [Pomacea canaliculata]